MRRERVWEAVRHKETGNVPYNIELTGEELEKVAAYVGIEKNEFFDWAGNHIEKGSYNTIKDTIRILANNGGYIASPTHQVPSDVPPENIAALVEVLKKEH